MLKPEITQQDKLGHSPNPHQDVFVGRSSGMAKLVSLFGNPRSCTSKVMLGLTVLIGIATLPANYPNTVAAAESINFGGEASVPIEIAPPKQRTFKSVATASPVAPNNSGSEGDLVSPEDRLPAGQTTIGFSWPTKGTITSKFGRRWGRMHKGIDIAAPIGTPINAAADGTVVVAGYQSGYGNLVEIRHIDGTTTRYGHNSELSVSVGQTVRQGQQVARMGSTGHSTGSHLHFEIRPSGGNAVNPIALLPANS